jgi:hypothetical protein
MSATDTRGRFVNLLDEIVVDELGNDMTFVVNVYDGIQVVGGGKTFVSVDALGALSREDALRLRDALTAAVAFIDEGQRSG